LAAKPFTITPKPTVFTPATPLWADNDVVTVCVQLAPGYEAADDFTVRTPEGTKARLYGEITLTRGAILGLKQTSQLDIEPCVDPDVPGPLSGPVRQVSLASTIPVRASGATWHSTAP